ncbi:MAG TPA: Wss1p-related putative metallopeptidase [Chloroflexota bacterium]|nr:Wss1p-related putative metallopeptidase [Chloroflexota bacterium]
MSNTPTRAAQTALLTRLRAELEPLLSAERLPTDFELQPGVRLRRAYGRCVWSPATQHAVIALRCTADGDRTRWRQTGAIMGTLLHEAAHLRYRSHGPRFWALHRRLVDRAVAVGVYDPTDRDPAERGRGDEKLAASAARPIALAARAARLERAQANRQALRGWEAGAVARVAPNIGRLAGAVVRVVELGRTRLLVETADRQRYRIPPSLLIPA